MIVVDAHQDIAYNALVHGREFTRSVHQQRAIEAAMEDRAPRGPVANGLPEALKGRLGIIFSTLFTEPAWSPYLTGDRNGYETPQEAYQQALTQWDYYQRLVDEQPQVGLVRTAAELDAVLERWSDDSTEEDRRVGLVLLMEGGDAIMEPSHLEEWVARGLRIVGPAWSETRYAGGSGRPGPLTDLGRELLDVMASFNLVLDVSHMTSEGYNESLERYEGPILASHSNPRAFFDNERNLSDEQIRMMADRDGVIGVVMYNRFLDDTWYRGAPKHHVPFVRLIDVIDHVCQVTGSPAHVGIGSDIDGGFGASEIPEGIDTVVDFLKIGDGLRERGYAEVDIAAVLGQNFLRVLRRALA